MWRNLCLPITLFLIFICTHYSHHHDTSLPPFDKSHFVTILPRMKKKLAWRNLGGGVVDRGGRAHNWVRLIIDSLFPVNLKVISGRHKHHPKRTFDFLDIDQSDKVSIIYVTSSYYIFFVERLTYLFRSVSLRSEKNTAVTLNFQVLHLRWNKYWWTWD